MLVESVTDVKTWVLASTGMSWGEGGANTRSERSWHVLMMDDAEHSEWSLQIVVCLRVQMYTFLNVRVCEFMCG